MAWQERLKGDARAWLLEPDPANPAIRYFALRDLLERPPDGPEVIDAQAAIMAQGPAPLILDAQHPGGGYGKYRGTVWQLIDRQLGRDHAQHGEGGIGLGVHLPHLEYVLSWAYRLPAGRGVIGGCALPANGYNGRCVAVDPRRLGPC